MDEIDVLLKMADISNHYYFNFVKIREEICLRRCTSITLLQNKY
jgi:hypothetical protein